VQGQVTINRGRRSAQLSVRVRPSNPADAEHGYVSRSTTSPNSSCAAHLGMGRRRAALHEIKNR
jgi:hypothetical protein